MTNSVVLLNETHVDVFKCQDLNGTYVRFLKLTFSDIAWKNTNGLVFFT